MKQLSDDVQFLLLCLDGFKGCPDWKKVAHEANISTPKVASNRLGRLRKARDEARGAFFEDPATPPSSPKKDSKSPVLSPRSTRVTKRTTRSRNNSDSGVSVDMLASLEEEKSLKRELEEEAKKALEDAIGESTDEDLMEEEEEIEDKDEEYRPDEEE